MFLNLTVASIISFLVIVLQDETYHWRIPFIMVLTQKTLSREFSSDLRQNKIQNIYLVLPDVLDPDASWPELALYHYVGLARFYSGWFVRHGLELNTILWSILHDEYSCCNEENAFRHRKDKDKYVTLWGNIRNIFSRYPNQHSVNKSNIFLCYSMLS